MPSVILFNVLPVLPMHRIRRGAPRRHAPLAPASFVRSLDVFFPWSAVFGFDGSVPVPRPGLFGLSVSSDKAFTVFLAVVLALFSIGILALRRGTCRAPGGRSRGGGGLPPVPPGSPRRPRLSYSQAAAIIESLPCAASAGARAPRTWSHIFSIER